MILAVAIASMAGFNSMAQVSAKATSGVDEYRCYRTGTECCYLGDDCKDCRFFDGVNLTADQQSKLETLRADCKAGREKCIADRRAAREQARANREQDKRDRLNKVKGILTPEQYVVFLENIVVSDAPKYGHRPNAYHNGRGVRGKDFKRGAARQSIQSDAAAK